MTTSLLVCCVVGVTPASAAPRGSRWVTTWGAAPDSAGPALPAQTLRQIMRVSVGGEAVRLRISNEYGDRPLQVHAAELARHAQGPSIVASSARTLRRGGQRSFTIAAGDAAWTDPVELEVGPLEELAVSLHFAQGTGASTIHSTGMQTAYTCLREDQTRAATLKIDDRDDSRYFVTDIDVRTQERAYAVVVVGDSTTDGVGTRLDSNTRWPDQLAERLQAAPALRHVAVVNSGISGNRILNDGLDPFLGPSTLKRLERDALSKSGVRWLILLQGINDITASSMFDSPQQKVSAGQLIAAMKEIIERSHARGLRVVGATILPRQGAQGARAHTPAGEAVRQEVNAWIRGENAFDAVVDFDRAVRDPDQPDRQLPAFNSGDFSHPNAAGYGAMARAVDLRAFEGPAGSRPER